MRYWLSCVMWNFGSGKTFWTFLEMYQVEKRNTYIIANVPYSRVDHYYSTQEDLLKVFEVLDQYTSLTNQQLENFYDAKDVVKDILVVVDEAHLYLWARESLTKSSILNKLKLIFTQCRKRKIRIVFITQRLSQIDIYVRRLSDYVEEYNMNTFLWLDIDKHNVYLNKWDVIDIETDQSIKINTDWDRQTVKEETLIYSDYFAPLTSFLELGAVLFNKWYREILKEEYLTYHVCGLPDPAVKEFSRELLMKWLIILPTKEEYDALMKKRENRGKSFLEVHTPKLYAKYQEFQQYLWVNPLYQKTKKTIKNLFHPGYADLDFQTLFNEAEQDELSLEKVQHLDEQLNQKENKNQPLQNENYPQKEENQTEKEKSTVLLD